MSKGGLSSNIEWIAWGKTDPLYAVATWPGRQKSGAAPWNEEEFYSTGEAEWRVIFEHWSHFGVERNCCVEIGCGAGRFSGPLSRCFQSLHAVDVSPEMIELARKRAATAKFYLTEGATLPLPDLSATAVFSCFVFRHFDRLSDAERYFREIHRVLSPGGSLLLELPVYIWPTRGSLLRPLYKLRKIPRNAVANFRRFLIRKGRGRPFVRLLSYEACWVFDTLQKIGFDHVEIRFFSLLLKENLHSWVFARKSSTGSPR